MLGLKSATALGADREVNSCLACGLGGNDQGRLLASTAPFALRAAAAPAWLSGPRSSHAALGVLEFTHTVLSSWDAFPFSLALGAPVSPLNSSWMLSLPVRASSWPPWDLVICFSAVRPDYPVLTCALHKTSVILFPFRWGVRLTREGAVLHSSS